MRLLSGTAMSKIPDSATLWVLLADDSAVARLAVARRLRAEGFHVVEGGTAEEALANAAGTHFACALLDLDLGDADGSEVAQHLRRARHDLPIAFFSDLDSSETVRRARTMGPVFEKPHGLDDAVSWVKLHAR